MAQAGSPDTSSGKGPGDIDFEIGFYEAILKRLPDSIDVLMALGDDYTQRGLFEKGLGVDEALCRLRDNDPIVRYNLACSYSLLGKVDQAIATLREAIALGYRDSTHLQRDPDLDRIRRDPRYTALLNEILHQQMTS